MRDGFNNESGKEYHKIDRRADQKKSDPARFLSGSIAGRNRRTPAAKAQRVPLSKFASSARPPWIILIIANRRDA